MPLTATYLAHATTAPSLLITVTWEHDPDDRWDDPLNADWTKGEDPSDWQAWQTTVTAAVVVSGRLVAGHDYLGGTWEKFGDDPRQTNPHISGYLPQMVEAALKELQAHLPVGWPLRPQITAALAAPRPDTT